MKFNLKHMILLTLLSQVYPLYTGAQDCNHPDHVERVILFTDRSLYIAGENICFSAALVQKNASVDGDFSKVLYVEIIDQNSFQVLGKKFPVSDFVCTGMFDIPPDMSTGIYYIRSYTKYMRNYGPESFCYNPIKVINPSRDDIQYEYAKGNERQTDYTNQPGSTDRDIFDIQIDKLVYGQRDSIFIRMDPKIHVDSLISVCISVVPVFSHNEKTIILTGGDVQSADFIFEPESYGITLTGMITDENSNRPLPGRVLDLTILGENSDFISIYSDSAGRFCFPLPEFTGQQNIYIGTRESDSRVSSIRIDNDFCIRSVPFPHKSFLLSEDERITALNLARNFQISQHFTAGNDDLTNTRDTACNTPFYGDPTETLNLDDYIQLPTLEDYFDELPFLVKVRRSEGEKYLKILGSGPELSIFQPLVLMDMVAVYDMDKILPVSFNDISHIDIINEPYVKGIMTYGGIVSIFSKNNDFAGIELPRSGIFLSYDFYTPPKPSVYCPDSSNIPDSRNTLFWDGNLQIPEDLPTEISFLTGNSNGHYEIILQGVMKSGVTFSQILTFLVE